MSLRAGCVSADSMFRTRFRNMQPTLVGADWNWNDMRYARRSAWRVDGRGSRARGCHGHKVHPLRCTSQGFCRHFL